MAPAHHTGGLKSGQFYPYSQSFSFLQSLRNIDSAIATIRRLGGIELLTSYFIVFWSEWNLIGWYACDQVCTIIKDNFSGDEMAVHRDELLRRLNFVRGRLHTIV